MGKTHVLTMVHGQSVTVKVVASVTVRVLPGAMEMVVGSGQTVVNLVTISVVV